MDKPVEQSQDAAQAGAESQEQVEQSQTAMEYINTQLKLEAEAREALPYAFDACTQPRGPLLQPIYACLTCNPPLTEEEIKDPDIPPYKPAGVCYSCSISCHGSHTLVELFEKRSFVCDCGTTRLPTDERCQLRINPATGEKSGCSGESPALTNYYNQNFENKFCSCEKEYDAFSQKGTMYKCLGLGNTSTGGCGEDWYHAGCLVGLDGDWMSKEGLGEDDSPPPPPRFPSEEDFEGFICFKCVESNPWIKRYAGTEGFLPPVYPSQAESEPLVKAEPKENAVEAAGKDGVPKPAEPVLEVEGSQSLKRKAPSGDSGADENGGENKDEEWVVVSKRAKQENGQLTTEVTATEIPKICRYQLLPPTPAATPESSFSPSSSPSAPFSLFYKEDFRDKLCRCADCFPNLSAHPQLLEEEEPYEPPLDKSSDEGDGASNSLGTGSILERGERALSNVDRVRAIEGVMVYNHLKEKVKDFLKPFAENGQAVGAEDIKAYFESLRGDTNGIQAASQDAASLAKSGGDGNDKGGDSRKEENGY